MDSNLDINTLRPIIEFVLAVVIGYTTLRFNHIKELFDRLETELKFHIEGIKSDINGIETTVKTCQQHCENKREEITKGINDLRVKVCLCEKDEE